MNVAKEIVTEAARRNARLIHATIEPKRHRALISVNIENVDDDLRAKLAKWENEGSRVIDGAGGASIGREVSFGKIPPESELGKAIAAEQAKRQKLLEGIEGDARSHFGPVQLTTTDLKMIKTLLGIAE